MKLLRSIGADVVRSMDARENAVQGLEASGDKSEACHKLRIEEKIEISMII